MPSCIQAISTPLTNKQAAKMTAPTIKGHTLRRGGFSGVNWFIIFLR
jgi:hypothetical protein